jgi:hypothetical protein
MEAPFKYFASAFGERIQDELSDLKAAGGFYSIAKRQKDPFVKSLDDAIEFQQETNRTFSKMAGALPGVTSDYVQTAKRLGDTITRIVSQDMPAAVAAANKIRSTEEGRQFYGGQITQKTGPEAQQETIKTLLGEMTKKTVLAGLGGRSGAGGMMGAYGLPGLAERMLSQETVSMGQFQRYAAIFGDPMIADALSRHVDKINATQKDSMARMEAFNKMIDEIVTPELVEKLRTSFDGVYQGLRSAIIDPDQGLFGLGRQMQGLGKRLNSLGQYIDKFGNVVEDVNLAASVDLSLFEMLRDIFSQTGQVLSPIVSYLPEIWDPLRRIAEALKDARHYTAEFLRTFNSYREGLKDFAKQLGGQGQLKIMESLDIRASMAAINNLFAQFGVYGENTDKEFSRVAKMLKDPNLDIGKLMSELLNKLFTSDIAKKIGEFLGNLIGTVLRQVADATKYVSGMVEGGGFAGGFASAFQKSGGFSAIQDIFMSITQLFVKALLAAVTKMPLLSLTVVGLAALPAIIGAGIASLVERAFRACEGMTRGGACPLPEAGRRGGRRGSRGTRSAAQGVADYGEYRGRPRRYGAGGSIERLNRTRRSSMARGAANVGKKVAYSAEPFINYAKTSNAGSAAIKGIQGFTKGIKGLTKLVPGGAVAAGAIDMATSVASGENFGKAAVGAFGTVLGGAAGSIFGPVGTVIGGIVGGMIADAGSDLILGALDQNKAAAMQIEAARQQVEAAASAATNKYGPEFGAKLGGIEALSQALGGGAGVQQYAEEQLRLGKITAEQAQNWTILSKQLTNVNTTTSKVDKAQKAYDTAVKLNTGQQEKYKKALEAAQREQQTALSKITLSWEQMSATNRTRLLQSADNIRAALDEAAAKIRGWKGIPGVTPAPPPKNPQPQVRDTSTPSDQPKDRPNPLDSRKLIPGLPATPESGFGAATGRLGDAISKEMRMKPPGSDLVIANSSETVIPAAGGYGMLDFVETLRAGFNRMATVFQTAQQKQDGLLRQINNTLVTNQQQTNARLATLETKFTSPTMPGGLGGASAGGVDAFTSVAQGFGLQMTSGYRPGDPGWHGANRARDFSNGTGPTPQMMQFAQYLASTYGSSLKELIYTPLGYSIKDGQIVPPYAQNSHYNHVHVAYAQGLGNPAFFSNQKDAASWEKQHLGAGVKSITTNSAELSNLLAQVRYQSAPKSKKNWMQILDEDYQRNINKPIRSGTPRTSGRGGLDMWEGPQAYIPPSSLQSPASRGQMASAPMNITVPITVNQQPGEDGEALANRVATLFYDAMNNAQSASIFG